MCMNELGLKLYFFSVNEYLLIYTNTHTHTLSVKGLYLFKYIVQIY